MTHSCAALILSKKGFGEGSLLLTVLDSQKGKTTLVSYGAALETGSRRAALLSGNIINGLVLPPKNTSTSEILSEAVVDFSPDNLRSQFKPMGFLLYTLEILDILLPFEALFSDFYALKEAFVLFNETGDEKFILFFLGALLSAEGWLDIQEKEKLSTAAKRFLNDALTHPSSFLQGKHISPQRKHELSYFFSHAVRKAAGRSLKAMELLRFDIE